MPEPDALGFEELPVFEVIPAVLEVLGQVEAGLGQAGVLDERELGVFERVQICRRKHPGVGDHDRVRHRVTGLKSFRRRDECDRLGLVSLEQVQL